MLETLAKPIAVVGLGVTGLAVIELLKQSGMSQSQLMTFDEKLESADYSTATDLIQNGRPKTLIVSPGVPLAADWIKRFESSGGQITSELEIAFSFLKTERLICVTGSVGKSTTVGLLGHGLQSFTKNYFVGGNFGTPLANYVVEVLNGSRERAEWIVLELSSFQLENFKNLSCEIGAITNLLPNHLERYRSKQQYYQTKWALCSKVRKVCLLNEVGGELKDFTRTNQNLNACKFVSANSPELQQYQLNETTLIGSHNLDNLSLAASVALAAGWPDSCIQAMKVYPGLEHRLENCGTYSGRTFINDSKATTIDSVIQAVKSTLEKKIKGQLIVLVGGRDKNLPWKTLSQLSKYENLKFYFFGEFGSKAQEQSGLPGKAFPTLASLLADIKKISATGDTVLLSPGGSSYDEFKNFEERGNFFKAEVVKC